MFSRSQESLLSPIDRRSAYYRAARRAEAEAGEGEGDPSAAAHPEPQPLLTPPNVLTLLRVVLVPVFVVAWYSQGVPPSQRPRSTSLPLRPGPPKLGHKHPHIPDAL